MVMDVLWLLMCFFMGIIAGGFGEYLVASMALAASDAMFVGLSLGFIVGAILIGVVRCVEYFGNDLVFYAMRKNVKKFLEEKITYLKTGKGSNLIKTIPTNNIIRLYDALHFGCGNYKDILTILSLYEKGVTINDIVQERTLSNPDAQHHDVR